MADLPAVAAALLVLALVAPKALPAKTYRADRFDVRIDVQPDRSLLVHETVVFRFEGGPFTSVYRELRTSRTDGVSDIVASIDGAELPEGRTEGSIEVRRQRTVRVTWHLPPTSDATHVFDLRYRVAGAVAARAGRDELEWQVLPTEHSYAIAESTVKIYYPPSALLLSAAEVRPTSARATADESQLSVENEGLTRGTHVLVALAFAPGGFQTEPPAWQRRDERDWEMFPLFGSIALAILLAGIGGLAVYGIGHRLPATSSPSDVQVAAPPDSLPIAVAGALIQSGAQPTWPQAFATLLELARRGVVRIDEARRRLGISDFVLRLEQPGTTLNAHERGLVNLIFGSKHDLATEAKLSSVRQHLASRWKCFREPLKEELRYNGLIDAAREATRRALRNLGIALLLLGALGFALGVIFIDVVGPFVLVVPGALEVVAIVAVVMGAVFSPLSEHGAWTAAAWRGFAAYIKGLTHAGADELDPALFERLLIYAVAFNLGPRWVKSFSRTGHPVAVPEWFGALAGAGAGDSHAFAAFIATSSAASAAGHGGAGAGVGGVGGGGASGAS